LLLRFLTTSFSLLAVRRVPLSFRQPLGLFAKRRIGNFIREGFVGRWLTETTAAYALQTAMAAQAGTNWP